VTDRRENHQNDVNATTSTTLRRIAASSIKVAILTGV